MSYNDNSHAANLARQRQYLEQQAATAQSGQPGLIPSGQVPAYGQQPVQNPYYGQPGSHAPTQPMGQAIGQAMGQAQNQPNYGAQQHSHHYAPNQHLFNQQPYAASSMLGAQYMMTGQQQSHYGAAQNATNSMHDGSQTNTQLNHPVYHSNINNNGGMTQQTNFNQFGHQPMPNQGDEQSEQSLNRFNSHDFSKDLMNPGSKVRVGWGNSGCDDNDPGQQDTTGSQSVRELNSSNSEPVQSYDQMGEHQQDSNADTRVIHGQTPQPQQNSQSYGSYQSNFTTPMHDQHATDAHNSLSSSIRPKQTNLETPSGDSAHAMGHVPQDVQAYQAAALQASRSQGNEQTPNPEIFSQPSHEQSSFDDSNSQSQVNAQTKDQQELDGNQDAPQSDDLSRAHTLLQPQSDPPASTEVTSDRVDQSGEQNISTSLQQEVQEAQNINTSQGQANSHAGVDHPMSTQSERQDHTSQVMGDNKLERHAPQEFIQSQNHQSQQPQNVDQHQSFHHIGFQQQSPSAHQTNQNQHQILPEQLSEPQPQPLDQFGQIVSQPQQHSLPQMNQVTHQTSSLQQPQYYPEMPQTEDDQTKGHLGMPQQQPEADQRNVTSEQEESKVPVKQYPDAQTTQTVTKDSEPTSRGIRKQSSSMNRPSVLDTGVFTTPRPAELEAEFAEAIEEEVQALIELFKQGEEGKEEFDEKHQTILEDYDEMPDDKAYYLKLFKEAFRGDFDDDLEIDEVKTKEDRMFEAYQELENAIEIGQFIKSEDFKKITKYASEYDEEGRNIFEKNKYYFIDESDGTFKDLPFDVMIRGAVYKLLKYRGSFYTMITSKYFIAPEQKKQFYYNASAKVPFYYIYKSSLLIQNELMSKYLENPFNPMMFIEYKQDVKGFDELTTDDPRVERTINVGLSYLKYKKAAPNLICIGNPCSGKSSLLNDILKAEFEVLEEQSLGMFHDSVDVHFTSKDMPIGFNVFDFQGALANRDWLLIEKMLVNMPMVYLFVQISDTAYIKELTKSLNSDLLKQFSQRVFVVSKNKDDRQSLLIKKQVRNAFKISDDRLNELKGNTSGPNYERACKTIYEFLHKDMKDKEEYFKEQNQLLIDQFRAEKCKSDLEYKHIYSAYWLLEDSLMRFHHSKNFNVVCKEPEFRSAHMKTKQFLFSQIDMSELSRKKIFPQYMKEYQLLKIEKELRHRGDRMDQTQLDQMQKEKQRLINQDPQHGKLFTMFLKYLMGEQRDIAQDFLELVEAHYLPRVVKDQEKISELKQQSSRLDNEIATFEEDIGRIKSDATDDEKAKYRALKEQKTDLKTQLDQIMSQIEDIVLDSELFLRETKQMMLKEPDEVQKEFHVNQAKCFEDGTALEVIDGDIDQVERVNFTAIMEWIQKQCNIYNKLLVVTIIGPQSSGKSTLLNYLVGAKFHVSAGRCTKGLNAMLLKTDFGETEQILILDSEGIFSIERQDPMYDRRLAIFCLSVSNLLLINIKGELNIEIEKVLQVAIFALNKIAEVAANLKKARIHFILRDQMETGVNQMEEAFGKLKSSLREAASAAGAQLDNLIELPDRPDQIISMFPSALELQQVNNNREFVQTRSSDVFRQECSKLRLLLMDIARNLPETSRIINIQKWGQDVTTIWTSVNENDDLVMIRDLKHINDYRALVIALEDFRKLMSAPAPQEEKDYSSEPNPLLPGHLPEGLKADDKILTNKTIFAEFDNAITEALRKQDNVINQTISIEDFRQTQQASFNDLNKEWIKKTCQWAKYFTSKMSEELQRQALSSVQNIVNSIYQKTISKWKEAQASNFIEASLLEMQEQLKNKIIEAKEQNRNIAENSFKELINAQSWQTEQKIRTDFFKNRSQMSLEVKQEFKEIAQSAARSEEQKSEKLSKNNKTTFTILKTLPACFQNEWIKDTPFEEKNLELVQIEGYDFMEWCEPNLIQVRAQVKNYVETNDPTYLLLKKEEDQLFEKIKDIEDASGWLGTGFRKKEVDEQDRIKLQCAKDNARQMLEEQQEIYLGQTVQEIQKTMHLNWFDLCKKVGSVISEISRYNQANKSQQSLPEKYVTQLLDIFNNELKRQAEGSKVPAVLRDLKDIYSCIEYKTQKYIEAFNQILYNTLLSQAERNNNINLDDVRKKLDETKEKSLKYYHQSSQDVKSDAEAAWFFVKIVVQRVCEILTAELKERFNSKIYGLDSKIEKKEIMDRAVKKFMEATDYETIILHMTDPVALERQIFHETFMGFKRNEGTAMICEFKEQLEKALTKIDNFINDIRGGFATLGASKTPVQPEQLQNLYKYMYGEIFKKEVEDKKLKSMCDKKDDVKKDKLFESDYDWRSKTEESLFSLQFKTQSYTDTMIANDILLLEKDAQLQNLIVFFKMIQFSANNKQAEIFKLKKEVTDAFVKEIKEITQKHDNEKNAENVALGCRRDCPFCGARCMEAQPCESPDHKKDHTTMYHRPMAFKGTHERVYLTERKKRSQACEENQLAPDVFDPRTGLPRQVPGQPLLLHNEEDKEDEPEKTKKVLLRDYCTSESNLKESRWPKPEQIQSGMQKLLERLGEDMQLTTQGMNIYVKWTTGSDLDLQVMCGCGKWHGYGTTGGSGGHIKCNICKMSRDYDVTTGEDGRQNAFEHAFFAEPSLLYGKEIGVGVHNYCQDSDARRNDFELAVFNKYGMIIYPNEGETELQHDPTWMFTANQSKSGSQRKTFIFQDKHDQMGKGSNANRFLEHMKVVQDMSGQGNWNFNEAQAQQNAMEQQFIDYRKSWNEKWAIVKDIMCGPDWYECELLENVIDFDH